MARFFFGRLTDRWGRKKLFIITLGIYLVGSGIAGLAWAPWFLYIWRFVAGMGIGGEYTAINSAIDELIPAKYRGRVDIAVNGTYWAGAMLGAVSSFFLLNHALIPEGLGWRLAFFVGPVLGLVIIFVRRQIPESPRWMVTHGLGDEANRIVDDIEASVRAQGVAISYFFAISQVVGSMGPLIFANFVGNGTDRVPLFWGYVLGAGVMIFGGLVAWFFGVKAEGKGLEDIATPLTSVKAAHA